MCDDDTRPTLLPLAGGCSCLLGLVLLCVGLGFYVPELEKEGAYESISAALLTGYDETEYECGYTDEDGDYVQATCTNYYYKLAYEYPEKIDAYQGMTCAGAAPDLKVNSSSAGKLQMMKDCQVPAAALGTSLQGYIMKGGTAENPMVTCLGCPRGAKLEMAPGGGAGFREYTLILYNNTKAYATINADSKQQWYYAKLKNPKTPKGVKYDESAIDTFVGLHVRPKDPGLDPRLAFPDSFVPGMQLIISGCVFLGLCFIPFCMMAKDN